MLKPEILWIRDEKTWDIVLYSPTIKDELWNKVKWEIDTSSIVDLWCRIIIWNRRDEVKTILS